MNPPGPPAYITAGLCPGGLVATLWIHGELVRRRELPPTLDGEAGVLELMAELDAELVDGVPPGDWLLAIYDGDTGAPTALVADWT